MSEKSARSAKITAENLEESARLKKLYLAKGHGLSQEAFGATYNIGNQAAVGFFLNGKSAISMKAAVGFAKALNCEIADFSPRLAAQATEISSAITVEEEDDFVEVRRMAVGFSNGRGKLVFFSGSKAGLAFRRDYLKKLGVKESQAVVVNADGQSNEPTIPDGSVVLVDRGDKRASSGKLYAFRLDGELMIKRFYPKDDGCIDAVPDNPDRKQFPVVELCDDGRDFQIIGRVRWVAAEV